MKKRFFLSLLVISGILLLLYLFQPLKRVDVDNLPVKYELEPNWPALPGSVELGNPTGIALDTNQNLVVFHRASRTWPLFGGMPSEPIKENTILVLDRHSGNLLQSWGSNRFIMPHGLKVDRQNNIWVTDCGLHQVFKFSFEGKLLLQIGVAGIPGNDASHFNKPTDVAISADGSFYVADGYGNSRIMKFSADGRFLRQWGRKGLANGEFDLPHGLAIDSEENLYVADRENKRVQVFDSTGKFLKLLDGPELGSIGAVAIEPKTSRLLAVDDVSFFNIQHRGSDVLIWDKENLLLSRFGRSNKEKGGKSWYHALAIDSDDAIYLCDILHNTIQKYRKTKDTGSLSGQYFTQRTQRSSAERRKEICRPK